MKNTYPYLHSSLPLVYQTGPVSARKVLRVLCSLLIGGL